MDSLFTSSPCLSPTDIGDYVMMESCVEYGCVMSVDSCSETCSEHFSPRPKQSGQRRRNHQKKRTEFPPPLTVLAMTENHRPHMPFVMRRFTTDDGRLVIVEERARHHDYFRVTRSEGRLVLDLVAAERGTGDTEEREGVDGDGIRKRCVDVEERESDDVEEREGYCFNVVSRNKKGSDDMEQRESDDMEEREGDCFNVVLRNKKEGDDVEERASDDVEERETADGSECCNVAIRSVGKCYDYMRVRSSPCLFTMTLPTVRPVHI